MAESPELNGRPKESVRAGGFGAADLSGAPRALVGDKTAHRASAYFILFLALFVGGMGRLGSDWTSSLILHTAFESISTFLAFVVGALALVRFYSKKQEAFLFLGTGFLGTGVLDTYHAVLMTGFAGQLTSRQLADLSSWSFTASAVYLALFLLGSLAAWRRQRQSPGAKPIRELTVYLTALLLTVVVFAVFNLFPIAEALYPDQFLGQPAELIPAGLMLVAVAGHLWKGHWRFDSFEHWLVLGLILATMAHGGYMPFSNRLHDADFDAAHVLKMLSYTAVLVGLMANVYQTFRREEEAAEAFRTANTALAKEIDYRRKAERVVQESEERLQDFLDNAHDLIQSVDRDGRFLYVNQAWKAVLGYSDADLQQLTLFDVLHPGCRERCRSEFESVFQGSTVTDLEVDFVAADGSLVRCSGSANAWFEDDEAVATRSIFRDITEQVEARRQLEGFKANLQALVENTGDAIWSVDRSKRLITFNTAFSMGQEVRSGREPRVGDEPSECFSTTDGAWYSEMYDRALVGEGFSELRDEEVGGQIRSFEFFFNPIREAMGITGVAVFSKDVTARRRTQLALRMAKEEAERANQAKSQFLANMSHELRTPLNSVIGFTNILLKKSSNALGDQEIGFLERIAANGKHLLELINEVLDLAKIEAGRMEMDVAPVHLDELVEQTLAQIAGQVRGKDVVLRGDVPEGMSPLNTDGGKLKQVIINLVGNALKFTEKGEVVVRVIPRSDGRTPAAVAVTDTGIGIPPDRLQAIFEAFQQADGSTGRRFGGTGLGLTISRSLCQLLGFDLKVDSVEGEGSTFTILLEEVESPEKRAEEELMEEALRPMESTRPRSARFQEARTPGKRRVRPTVLVIDDEGDARSLLRSHLTDMGCRVLVAKSATEGMETARREGPDLITLDLVMPGMTGWEALKLLKENPDLQHIPVIVVSVVADEERKSSVFGSVDLLTKPVDPQQLLSVLRRNLKETQGKTVLVVEDDAQTRALIKDHLQQAGLKTVLAANGAEAEAALDEGHPALIVLDLVMPVMDGTAFLQRLRSNPSRVEIPVVICTGKILSAEEKQRLLAQATEIVGKGDGFGQALLSAVQAYVSLPPRRQGRGGGGGGVPE